MPHYASAWRKSNPSSNAKSRYAAERRLVPHLQRRGSAQNPAPNMRPRLPGNTGEMGEFVLPLNIPATPGGRRQHSPTTTSPLGTSWTLTAHEARPDTDAVREDHPDRRVDYERSLPSTAPTSKAGASMRSG
jgi:hypothetical protein